jgi:hypothetical protein
MARATLHVNEDRLYVNIMSKRAVVPGPVFLDLSPEDAKVLGEEILHIAGPGREVGRKPNGQASELSPDGGVTSTSGRQQRA